MRHLTDAGGKISLMWERINATARPRRRIVAVIEGDTVYRGRYPKGEPQLGRHGLYPAMRGQRSAGYDQMALMWVLNLADGHHSLVDMAERAGLPFATIRAAANVALAADLLKPMSAQRRVH